MPYARLEQRTVALILDLVVLAGGFMLLVAAGGLQTLIRSDFGEIDPPDSAVWVWIGFILASVPLSLLYFVLLWAWRGQTLGMMAVHIRVVTRDGRPPSLGRAAVRLIGYGASALPLFLGFAIALFDRERRTLHDHLAGTVVVEAP